jgi:tetratricopeptide (TPR) repeat protein
MLETIREYSIERLQQSGEEAATKRAHAAYCLVLAEEGNPELSETERAAWLARCDIEYDDFRAALDWLLQTRDLDWGFRFCIALFRFWDMREHTAEGRDRLEHILQMAGFGYPRERAKICLFLGAFSTAQGDFAASGRFLEQSLAVYRELDDPSGLAIAVNAAAILARDRGDYAAATINFEKSLAYWRQIHDQFATARCLHNLGNVLKIRGEYERARMALTEAMQIFQEFGDHVGAAWAINQLGDVAAEQGDLAAARGLYQKALAAFRGAGDRWGVARSLADLGTVACALHERANAYDNFRESLEIYREHGHKRGMARVIEGLACLALFNGEPRQALAAVAAATHLRQTVSAPLLPADQTRLDQQLQRAWQQLGEAEGKKAWAEGSTMPLDDAIQLALSGQTN